MRLFLAINFTDSVKRQIFEMIHYLEPKVRQGKFVPPENLHLTLEFLGEIEETKIHEIAEIMDTLNFENFKMHLNKLGYFKTGNGRIYWLGMEENEGLLKIQRQLHQKLLEKDYKLESRPYTPHITIGRKIKLKEDLNMYAIEKRLKQIEINVQTIDLMESKIVDGKLNYSVIASKPLL